MNPAQPSHARPARSEISRFLAHAWPYLALAGIIVLAAVLRMHDIVANPPGFFSDEASFGYNAWSILHTARDEHDGLMPVFFRAFGEYKLPVYIYSQVPLVALLGLSELPVRLTTALYGTATVVALYLLINELFRDRLFALCAAATLAVLPWHVAYSRTGLGDITVHVFFLVLGLYLFAVGLRRPALWPVAGLAFALALFSYRAAWVVLPPILVVLIALYRRELWRNRWYALGAAVVLLAAGVLIARHLLGVENDRAQDQWILSIDESHVESAKRFLSQYGAHFTPGFLFREERTNLRHVIPGQGWLYLWQAPFIALGVLALLWQPSRPKLLALALLALYPLPAAVTISSPETSRAFVGTVAFSIVTAYGLVSAGRLLGAWRPERLPRLGRALAVCGSAGVVIAAAFGLALFLRTYHGSYQTNAAGREGWQYGARQVLEYFVAEEDNYDQLIMDGHGPFNDAAIFFEFYAHDCERCTLGKWDGAGNPDKYNPEKRQLFALQPESMVLEYEYKELGRLYYPNGELAFVFAEIVGKGR